MGLRPLSGKYFGDMYQYNRDFLEYAQGYEVESHREATWELFMKVCSKIMNVDFFFLLCSFIYVYSLRLVTNKFFEDYWFYAFLMFITSFTFWGAGVNGIRNGVASTIFLFALSRDSIRIKYLLMILSALIHKSLLIPFFAYILVSTYKNTKGYMMFWLLTIPLSLLLGSFFENFFLGVGIFEDDRLDGYFTELDEGIKNSKIGFRWDFLLYSATGFFAGWYFIFKKKFEDAFYIKIYSMYLIVNAFWILIIRANFSNRFAYLSWFMLPLVIIYPLLKNEIIKKQHQLIGVIILFYFIFTFVLNVILES